MVLARSAAGPARAAVDRPPRDAPVRRCVRAVTLQRCSYNAFSATTGMSAQSAASAQPPTLRSAGLPDSSSPGSSILRAERLQLEVTFTVRASEDAVRAFDRPVHRLSIFRNLSKLSDQSHPPPRCSMMADRPPSAQSPAPPGSLLHGPASGRAADILLSAGLALRRHQLRVPIPFRRLRPEPLRVQAPLQLALDAATHCSYSNSHRRCVDASRVSSGMASSNAARH